MPEHANKIPSPSGPLTALLDAIYRGRALLPNGALLLEVDAKFNDGMLWDSDASMLLDQDDLASLRVLAEELSCKGATATDEEIIRIASGIASGRLLPSTSHGQKLAHEVLQLRSREAERVRVHWLTCDALSAIRAAWNAHMETCPQHADLPLIEPPTEAELAAWRDAPSDTAPGSQFPRPRMVEIGKEEADS